MNDKKTLFSMGDVVVHKTSGQRAVVCGVHSACTNENHPTGLECLAKMGKDCGRKQVDVYDISINFGDTHKNVQGFLLELYGG